ncbi:MAG: DUF4159 domain-containing protein, partial [Kiritimatiellae bacterium]|nr:DUF4159 domain-containing protein [Kiritimatiellia bacterium]
MAHQSISKIETNSCRILSVAVLTAVFLNTVAASFGQAGRGASSDDWFIKAEKDNKDTLQMGVSAGEKRDIIPSVPGSPIPQVDRKKPPSPDFLMGKIKWGVTTGTTENKIQDWNLSPNDMLNFHSKAREKDFLYLPTFIGMTEFSFNPQTMPSIFLSGVRELTLTPAEISRLRQYVLDGGMIVCDSVYGSPWFYESALRVFDDMFKESRFRTLPPDHPLYHMEVDVDSATYRSGGEGEKGKPFFEGLYIGSRIGVLVSKYGLGCGMAGETAMKVFDDLEKKGLKPLAYSAKTAMQIAENLAPYVIGYSRVGEAEGEREVIAKSDALAPTAQFVFAQATHDGAWNAHPGAARQLLMRLERESSIPVNLKRVSIDLERDDMAPYPFLFFTGLDDFVLTDKQIAALRKHVKRGGTLLVNNALGLAKFHQAAIRELDRAFPDSKLNVLPRTHALFSSLYKVRQVKFTTTLEQDKGDVLQGRPLLFG